MDNLYTLLYTVYGVRHLLSYLDAYDFGSIEAVNPQMLEMFKLL